ncbi:hypothetical protein ACEN9X_13270 [Mucilaginibacter sp. Mucisp86]|uniref:hypothetical protein n=1 Tax=Mucilaginibacter sp. Mucisp86 TaxID=3243060 RepID=UPI0039B59EC0
MKKPKPALKKLLLLCVPVALAAILVGSCKKDNHSTTQPAVSIPAVADAKSWYEKAYPANAKLATQTASVGQDWSQGIKPDWNNGATYTRYEDDVVELPVDAAISGKLNIGLKEQTTGTEYKAANSKSSFLLIKSLGVYHAYIMTIIGDPAYLKGDLTKLDKNKYNKRDSNFTGVVLYSTPKGKFVNAWTYKNGAISGHLSPDSASSASTASGKEQINAVKTNLIETTTCYTWTQTSSYNGQTTGTVVLDSYCVTTYSGGMGGGPDNNGGSGSPGGDGGGGGTGSPGTPPAPKDDPCAPKGGSVESIGKTVSVNGVQTNTYQPPATPVDPGGGFPPPDGNVPCATVVTGTTISFPTPDIIDSLGAKYPCTGRLIASLPNLPTAVARLIYQAFASPTGKNITFRIGDAAYFAANPKEDGYTQYENGISNVYINPAVLANASNEYRLVTLYHEAIHAYLDVEMNRLGAPAFATRYPAIHVVARPNYSPNITKQNDYYFDDGTTMAPIDPKHRTMADYFTQELRDAILAYNPSFPADRATGLARGGIFLNDTSNKYFNDSEKDVRTGNSVGTKCTP